MGKSFNDDIFNNSFSLDNINGLNISKEAIQENKQTIDLKLSTDLDEAKKQFNEYKKQQEKTKTTSDIDEMIQENHQQEKQIKETIKNKIDEIDESENDEKAKIIFTKKTMIFNQEYLDIIDGLAQNNDMQIKDVLNQLLGRAINQLDEKVRDKALKTGKKIKQNNKSDKSIF